MACSTPRRESTQGQTTKMVCPILVFRHSLHSKTALSARSSHKNRMHAMCVCVCVSVVLRADGLCGADVPPMEIPRLRCNDIRHSLDPAHNSIFRLFFQPIRFTRLPFNYHRFRFMFCSHLRYWFRHFWHTSMTNAGGAPCTWTPCLIPCVSVVQVITGFSNWDIIK